MSEGGVELSQVSRAVSYNTDMMKANQKMVDEYGPKYEPATPFRGILLNKVKQQELKKDDNTKSVKLENI